MTVDYQFAEREILLAWPPLISMVTSETQKGFGWLAGRVC
jgi:hypothetical protein